MYEPMWPFLLTYGSHDMRLTGFRRLTVVNGTPGKWDVTNCFLNNKLQYFEQSNSSIREDRK